MPNLTKKFQNTVFEHSLFGRGDKIILGVSGGPDSVCMLDIFKKLEKKYSLKLIIAHVNYGLRQKDSDRDEKFVRELAEKYGIEIFVLRPGIRQKNASENTLRKTRYDFFEKVRLERKFNFIAVAHNSDDQTETFLSRLIRGAGIRGLSAMKHKNENIIRPLIDISRKEVLKYIGENNLKYRTDKTNLKSKYLRNRIRNKLLPILEKDFNPGIRKTILDSIESISEDADYLEREAETQVKKSNLSVSKILKFHPSIQKRIIFRAIEKEKGNLLEVESSHIREILKILKSTKGKRQIVVLAGLKFERIGDKLKISNLK